jgi:hypothetical protein
MLPHPLDVLASVILVKLVQLPPVWLEILPGRVCDDDVERAEELRSVLERVAAH